MNPRLFELFELQVAAQTRGFSKQSIPTTPTPSEGRAGPSSRTTDQIKPQVREDIARPLLYALGHSLGASRAEGMLTLVLTITCEQALPLHQMSH